MIKNRKLTHIVGARPQFIKMAAVSHAIAKHNKHIEELIIHTGQHYDYELSKVFFDELKIPKPDYNLEVGSASHGEQTGEMLKRMEQILLKEVQVTHTHMGSWGQGHGVRVMGSNLSS